MRFLVVTNLYPPQELGGYGRSIADFVWGLQALGHSLQVLTSDAPYLGCGGDGPSGEPVDRGLQLKGTYDLGVRQLRDPLARAALDRANATLARYWLNQRAWDGVLVGNLDLLGIDLLQVLLEPGVPVLHHVGFVDPPFAPSQWPQQPHYRLLAASRAVRQALVDAGLPVGEAPVVYPGARVDLFGAEATGLPLPPSPDYSVGRPLRVGFAGLLMASKGAHTLLEAVALLRLQGLAVEVMLAGGRFQVDYVVHLEQFVQRQELGDHVHFVGQLSREELVRFLRLHHVGVFPSLKPEAFGIVAAETMASGLALVSSAVGGTEELFVDGLSGLTFRVGDPLHLAEQLWRLADDPELLLRLQAAGEARVRKHFSVADSALKLEQLWSAMP